MKANFRIISTVLIIVLVVILIGIVIYYYNMPIKVINTEINNVNSKDAVNTNLNTPIIVNNEKDSGEIRRTIITESGEINSESLKNNIEIKDVKKSEDKSSQVIITSESTISNREKREILNELDDTLMDLLDAVNSVQTVDESRLITEESEVQK